MFLVVNAFALISGDSGLLSTYRKVLSIVKLVAIVSACFPQIVCQIPQIVCYFHCILLYQPTLN